MCEPARFASLKHWLRFPFVHPGRITLVHQIWFGNAFSYEYRIVFQRGWSDFDWCQWGFGVKFGWRAGRRVDVEIGLSGGIRAFEFGIPTGM